MNNLLTGMTGFDASVPLGLPEGYGLFCIVLGISMICLAAFMLPEREKAEILIEGRNPVREPVEEDA